MTTGGPSSLLFIIPAYNEQESLPGVLAELAEAYPEADVVVIDDGSADATASVARAGGAVVLQLPYNLGIGGALRTGFRYAVRKGYERGVQFDADGQHHADEVPALLAGLDAGADM
ncbi:MAG TPA: glycosyltransferase family 2 protein, partial [Acidimicrobiales bacterium]|nr:glycosyltransferase family 2 protein [Acidimicrobiales bacterium]